jgi:hypothetical protein
MALYTYLPKYCIRVCQNVVFLFTENIALLLTGYKRTGNSNFFIIRFSKDLRLYYAT